VQPDDLRRFQRAVYSYYDGLGSPKEAWGWKFPETYLIGPCIAGTFPKARYLHLIRDGRDVAFKKHLTDNPNKKLGRALLERQSALGKGHHLQAAISWAFQVEQFAAFSEQLPDNQLLNVTFEHLCNEPDKTTAAICEFLTLPMTDACRVYISKEIDSGKIAQYRQSPAEQVREVEDTIRPTLKKYGYVTA
jgi:hypothetical protein